jgi:hypothetical protein
MAADRIEINLATLVFVGLCGDGALFVDGDGDEILLRASGNKHDLKAAAREFLKAAKAAEAR